MCNLVFSITYQVNSQGDLASLIVTAVKHPCLTNLCLDSIKCKSKTIGDGKMSYTYINILSITNLYN